MYALFVILCVEFLVILHMVTVIDSFIVSSLLLIYSEGSTSNHFHIIMATIDSLPFYLLRLKIFILIFKHLLDRYFRMYDYYDQGYSGTLTQ